MKLSISTLVCPNWSWPQIVGAASAHGIDGIDPRGLGHEIDVTKLPTFDAELDASMALLHEHGLEMPCLNTSIALVTPAPERWEMMLAECHRYARLAERSGAKFLRIFTKDSFAVQQAPHSIAHMGTTRQEDRFSFNHDRIAPIGYTFRDNICHRRAHARAHHASQGCGHGAAGRDHARRSL